MTRIAPSRIRAVVFDMDGVVVDSEPLYQQAEERLFADYGITIPPEDWKYFRGVTEERFYQLAQGRYRVPEDPEVLRRKGRQYVLAAFDGQLEFRVGFTDLHEQLRRRYRLGLVTSTPDSIYDWMDRRLDLSGYFDAVITGSMTARSKPHPEPYLEMMRRLGVAPEETAIIEDSIHGLNSALASGAWTIALTGSVPPEDMPPAHVMVNSLGEISLELIGGLGGGRA